MARSITKFTQELADYINQHIVGTEATKIKKCHPTGKVKNRGHMITMELILPEGIDLGDIAHVGPVFYAEELLQEFPNNTIGCIGEIVNARVNETYGNFLSVIQMQAQAHSKNVDEYGREDVILTAIPTPQCNKTEVERFLSKEEEELGLTCFLKAKMHENPKEGQVFYGPIPKAEGHEGTKQQWEAAAENSYRMSAIEFTLLSGQIFGGPDIPLIGSVVDHNGFYDFFYLLHAEKIWKGLKESFDAERIYIIPHNAFEAFFIWDNIKVQEIADVFVDSFVEKAVANREDKPLPVFVLDCDTMQVTKCEGYLY